MDNQKSNKIEDILNSLGSRQKGSGSGFLLYAINRQNGKGTWMNGKKKSLILRPAFALSAVVVVLIMNAALLFGRQSQEEIQSSCRYQKNTNPLLRNIA